MSIKKQFKKTTDPDEMKEMIEAYVQVCMQSRDQEISMEEMHKGVNTFWEYYYNEVEWII